MHELLPSLDVHLGGVSDVDAPRDLINSCSDNGKEIISKLSGFGQAIRNHLLLGNIPKLSNSLVISDSLFNADDVCKESLVSTRFQVMVTAEEVLVISES